MLLSPFSCLPLSFHSLLPRALVRASQAETVRDSGEVLLTRGLCRFWLVCLFSCVICCLPLLTASSLAQQFWLLLAEIGSPPFLLSGEYLTPAGGLWILAFPYVLHFA